MTPPDGVCHPKLVECLCQIAGAGADLLFQCHDIRQLPHWTTFASACVPRGDAASQVAARADFACRGAAHDLTRIGQIGQDPFDSRQVMPVAHAQNDQRQIGRGKRGQHFGNRGAGIKPCGLRAAHGVRSCHARYIPLSCVSLRQRQCRIAVTCVLTVASVVDDS